MLKQLRVQNFRLLRDVTIDLTGHLAVFIGPNSSGKSTVLEVIDFLGRCASEGLQAAFAAHGGFESVRTIGVREPIRIATQWSFVMAGDDSNPPGRWRLEWDIELDRAPNGAVLVRKESLLDHSHEPPRPLVETTPEGLRVVRPELGSNADTSAVKDPTRLAFEEVRDSDRFPGLSGLDVVVSDARVLGSLTAPPLWARPSVAGPSARDSLVLGPAPHLGRQGAGLANALYNLSIDHGSVWSDLERAFRAEFPFVRRIVFPPDAAGGRINFAVEDERFPERKIFASEMSDGMVAYLILLVAILQPEQIAVLGLDEPDATIHPTALRRLLDLAQRSSGRRYLMIVTHSNALLDGLHEPAKQVRIVENGPGGAVIKTLAPEALAAWREEYSLSDLRRMGLVDRPNAPPMLSEPANELHLPKKKRRAAKH